MTVNTGKWVVPKTLVPAAGNLPYGLSKWVQWNGGDAITPTKPRSSLEKLTLPARVTLLRPQISDYLQRAEDTLFKMGNRATLKAQKALKRSARKQYRHDLQQFRDNLKKLPRRTKVRKPKVRTLLPPQPFTKTIEVLSTPIYWNGRGYHSSLGYPYGSLTWRTASQYPPQLEYDVLEKLHTRAYGESFNPGVFVAEMPQALRMIRDSAARVALALRYLKRGQLRSVFRTLGPPTDDTFQRIETMIHGRPSLRRETQKGRKGLSTATKKRMIEAENQLQTREGLQHVSGVWLELQYGWKPLLQDMESGARYIGSCLNPPLGAASIRARKKIRQEYTAAPDQYSVGFTRLTVDFHIQYVIYQLRKEPRFVPSLHDISTVVWEKTPWSFVIDWVVPISGYLESLRTADALKGTVVKTVKVVNTYSDVRKGSLVPFFYEWMTAPVLAERIQIVRTVSDEIQPVSPVKGYQNTVSDIFKSATRTANAISLLSQQIAKTFPRR